MIKRFFLLIGRAFDPRYDLEKDLPKSLLFAQQSIEYLFKIVGFFLVVCLSSGISLAACSQNAVILAFPWLIISALLFYIAITTFGIPIFLMIGELKNTALRRVAGYLTIAVIFGVSLYSMEVLPMLDLIETYVKRLFPEVARCHSNIIEFGS